MPPDLQQSTHWLTSRSEYILFLMACLASAAPVFVAPFPPMVDLPQHATQVATFMALGNPDFPFSDLFEVRWFTPYLFGYGLVALLSLPLGILLATKVVVAGALASFPLATRFFLGRAGADPYWAWLTFSGLYGFAYQWGFLNFLVAAPVGMLFLGLVWQSQSDHPWARAVKLSVALHILFLSHALILAFFSLIAGAYWVATSRSVRQLVTNAWPVLTVVPAITLWFLIAEQHRDAGAPTRWALSWFSASDSYYSHFATWLKSEGYGLGRLLGMPTRVFGLRPNPAIQILGLVVILLPVLAGARIVGARGRAIPPLISLSFLFLVPHYLFGVAYIYQRFSTFLFPMLASLYDPPRTIRPLIRAIAPAIAFFSIAVACLSAHAFRRDTQGLSEILRAMEPGHRALSLVFTRDDSMSIAPTMLHVPAWYAALDHGVVDPSFAVTHVEPVVYKQEAIPAVGIFGVAWHPEAFDWRSSSGDLYDYFIVSAPADVSSHVFRNAPCQIELLKHAGIWWLYRKPEACVQSPH